MYSPKDILWYYRRHGFRETLQRTGSELGVVISALAFALYNIISESQTRHVCLIPRASKIDQDIFSLLTQHDGEFETLYVAVEDTDEADVTVGSDVEIVKIHGLKFIKSLANSELVITKDAAWQYRVFCRNSKEFIRIPHGISAKASRSSARRQCDLRRLISKRLGVHKNYTMTVASEMEYNRKAGILGTDTDNLGIYGYPRYDRIRYLKHNPEEAELPQEARDVLTSERKTNILYAPTHKDGAFKTDLFPFPDLDYETLVQFLEEHDIRIFVRMHIHEEGEGIEKEYIDGENIRYAGHEFSPSVIEMLPFFDALITDYSSVYLDYVLLDRPIIYVEDQLERYREIRGFAFEYTDINWPGPITNSKNEFLTQIEAVVSDNDDYLYERRFVRDTFHPTEGEGFISNIMENYFEQSEE